MGQFLVVLSGLVIPVMIVAIVSAGLLAKKNVYSGFVGGEKDGLKTAVEILPALAGLMVAVGILRTSGFLDWIAAGIGILTGRIGFPA